MKRARGAIRFATLVVLFLARTTLAAPPPAEDEGSGLETRVTSELSSYSDTDHVSVVTPSVAASVRDPLSGWSVGGSYLVDIVSAASVDIVSTASGRWQELRHAATLSGEYRPYDVGVHVGGAVSREPDYLSLSGGGGISFELANKTVNPELDYTYSKDTAGRTGTPFDVYSLPLTRHSLGAALELILDRETVFSLIADAIFESGQQEKPYRYLPVFAPDVAQTVPAGASVAVVNKLRLSGRTAESVPTTRQRYALTGRLAQRLADTTFILSERIYGDSWGLLASTSDLRMVFDASRRVYFWPHARVHFQNGVSFWQLAYVGEIAPNGAITVPKLRTGDRELSPLSALSLGAGVHWNVGPSNDPSVLSLNFVIEGIGTRYTNALYVDNRFGVFGATQFQAVF
jgi:Protein of unknown function (DUF3570)